MWADLRTAVWEGVTLSPQYTAGTAKQTARRLGHRARWPVVCGCVRTWRVSEDGAETRGGLGRWGGGGGELAGQGLRRAGPRTDCPLLRCCLRLAGP